MIVVTVWAAVKFFSKAFVNQQFNKLLETHKHELQVIIETNKFDLQRRMLDFNLFTTKKHEVYSKLFNCFLLAEGQATALGIVEYPDLEKYDEFQLEEFLKKIGMPITDILHFLNNWKDGEKSNLNNRIFIFYKNQEIIKARKYQVEAYNYYLISSLYLSEEVLNISEELSMHLGQYCTYIEMVHKFNLETNDLTRIRGEMKDKKQEIDRLITILKRQMQLELTIGSSSLV